MSETYDSGTKNPSASRGKAFTIDDTQQTGASAKERLHGFANKQKDIGLNQVNGFAKAAHKAADSLAEQNSTVASLVHEAADGLDRISANLRDRDVTDIYGSLHDFARRQPLAFLAGSFAVGVLLTRFLKSSSETGGEPTGEQKQPYHSSPSL